MCGCHGLGDEWRRSSRAFVGHGLYDLGAIGCIAGVRSLGSRWSDAKKYQLYKAEVQYQTKLLVFRMIYIHDSLLLLRDKVCSLHFRFLGIVCSNSSRWLMSSWWWRFFDIDFRGETLMEKGTMCSICLTIKLRLNHLDLKHRKWVYQVTTTGRGANNLHFLKHPETK